MINKSSVSERLQGEGKEEEEEKGEKGGGGTKEGRKAEEEGLWENGKSFDKNK